MFFNLCQGMEENLLPVGNNFSAVMILYFQELQSQ
jgi:hypothetical protein